MIDTWIYLYVLRSSVPFLYSAAQDPGNDDVMWQRAAGVAVVELLFQKDAVDFLDAWSSCARSRCYAAVSTLSVSVQCGWGER